jgi:hypothetical protein
MPSTTSTVGLEALALLDGDDAVLADLVHRLGDDLADLGVLVGAMVPTWAISLESETCLDIFWSFGHDGGDGLVDAALDLVGLAPAVTFLRPSVKMASA